MTDFPPFKKPTIYEQVATEVSDSAGLPSGSQERYEQLKENFSRVVCAPYGKGIPTLAQWERQHIESVLEYTKGNKSQAARILDVSIKTLYNKLHSYGLMPKKPITSFDYGKIEKHVLATHYKCIKAFSDGYGNEFRVGQYYQVIDKKQDYVLVRESFRRKPRWLKASRFEGV